ncbi:hypothetical protein A5759_15640 [Mycobacterium sp. 852014-52144_SCH5372336]|nr:hypothetical protein A5759_15640 [Mycobacterium sp. 852014-52144_SCH5372336]
MLAVALTAVLTGALWWGLRQDGSAAPSGSHVYFDFTRASDGPPPARFDTGQRANYSTSPTDPGSDFSVNTGLLTYHPTIDQVSAAYLSTPDMGSPVASLGASWVFSPGRGTYGAVALLVSRGTRNAMPPIVPPVALHFVATAVNWTLAVAKDEETSLETLAAGRFEKPLREDGVTSYTVSIGIDRDRAAIELPDGDRQVVIDPRIWQWRGNFATFEVYSNHGLTDSIGGFNGVWARSTGNS